MRDRHYFQKRRKMNKEKPCVICGGRADPLIQDPPFCEWCWMREHH